MQRTLVFTENDRRRIGSMIQSARSETSVPWRRLDELLWQLESSMTADSESIPDDVVTMHSTVCLVNDQSGEQITCTVVYPEDVELVDHAVSILDPLGSSLIGCQVGDTVECDQHVRPGAWQIVEISYQPEREGEFQR